jgi:hypothetical protein
MRGIFSGVFTFVMMICMFSALAHAKGREAAITVGDFFGGYDGASLIHPQMLGPNYFSVEAQSAENHGYQGTLAVWACAGIRLDHVRVRPGEALRIVVPNGNNGADLHAVYSYDREHWQLVTTQRTSFDFDVPLEPGHKAVYFATYDPYPYSKMLANDRVLAKSKYVKFTTIGKSVKGRPIPLATITDPSVPDNQKKRTFIIGGTHGSETASIYGVEGMLDFLTSEDPLAQEMRRSVIWKIIPILNVDAAADGIDRRSGGGINLYYDWGPIGGAPPLSLRMEGKSLDPSIPTTTYSQPETRAAHAAVIAFRPQVFLDVHSWHFKGDGFWGPEPASSSPAVTALENDIAKYFKIAHWDKEASKYASAPSVIDQLNIAATLPEFALSFDSDNHQKTPDSMRQQGVGILRGTYEYLNGLR